jgi:hypothetical protein
VLEQSVAQDDKKQVFDQHDMQGQAAIARMAELGLVIQEMNVDKQLSSIDDSSGGNNEKKPPDEVQIVIDLYSNYQRQVLRQRAKPPIAHLANWRKLSPETRPAIEEHDEYDEEQTSRPHSHAMTSVLGHASALIHPLLQWKQNLTSESPLALLCESSIQVLDNQAQTLVQTICEWFLEDMRVEELMKQTTETKACGVDLAALDALVDEMAFGCQLMARYTTLLPTSSTSIIRNDLLPEWTWKYAALERFLGVQQLHSALSVAAPVKIVMGLPLQVPSVVEDAQYLSTRALDRAVSTLSPQAMGTVAHSLSHDIWSTDLQGGVHQALLEQRGCWGGEDDNAISKDKKSAANEDTSTPKSGDFASALLDALDDDLRKDKAQSTSTSPASGGFLGSLNVLGGNEFQLDTQLCAMNGIFSASTACQSLVLSLEAWLDEHSESNSMISLAREELLRYSEAYTTLLHHQVQDVIQEWCGSIDATASLKGKSLHLVKDFVRNEDYELRNAASLAEAEFDQESQLLAPLKECKLLSQLEKCEAEVALAICQEISGLLSKMIPETLWRNKKQFTDWGSLLFSKQVRMLQTHLTSLIVDNAQQQQSGMAPPSFLDKWERLSQIVTVLQLERPADWSIYQSSSVLTSDELQKTMSLRLDFSPDAIKAICQAQNDSGKSEVLS